MQRQADNRHHLITQVRPVSSILFSVPPVESDFGCATQGLAFLTQYRTLRGTDTSTLDEIEFNLGRAFHQLGTFSCQLMS